MIWFQQANNRASRRLVAALALTTLLIGSATATKAVTINMSSLEIILSDPTDSMGLHMVALWAGWQTQVYEYNMPFIEVSNGIGDPTISQFRMTIGDPDYQFSNIFQFKDSTNSWNVPVTGDPALLGSSTPGIPISSSLEDGGDTILVDFGPAGLGPGETVRFQLDIDMDPGSIGTMMFADYTSVFINNGNDPNSVVTLSFLNSMQTASAEFPDAIVPLSLGGPTQARDYGTMQPEFGVGIDLNPIPEPTAMGLMAIAAAACSVVRRTKRG